MKITEISFRSCQETFPCKHWTTYLETQEDGTVVEKKRWLSSARLYLAIRDDPSSAGVDESGLEHLKGSWERCELKKKENEPPKEGYRIQKANTR